jgi:hypothetical protein
MTRFGGPGTRWWRSPAFVQPLLITIGGVVANIAIYVVAVRALDPPCPDASCGLLHYEINLLMTAAFLLCLPLAGMIITGFVVGQKSRDSGLAGRAILVGMPIVWLTLMVATEEDVNLSSVVSVVGLILVGLGFVLGRRGRSSWDAGGGLGPEGQSDATGPADPARSGTRCGRCGQILSPYWQERCGVCKAPFAAFPPVEG